MSEDEREEALRGLEHEIALLLRRIRRGVAERAALVHPDLHPTSFSLLLTLVDQGPHRAADLAAMFSLDKGAVSRVVRQLEGLGFVARTPDPEDGRASILAATAAAHERLAEMRARTRERAGERLADWTPASMRELADGLARFNAAVFSD